MFCLWFCTVRMEIVSVSAICFSDIPVAIKAQTISCVSVTQFFCNDTSVFFGLPLCRFSFFHNVM